MFERGAFTISTFCENHEMSRAFFYKLVKQGLAPTVINLGGKRLITKEAAEDWRKKIATAK